MPCCTNVPTKHYIFGLQSLLWVSSWHRLMSYEQAWQKRENIQSDNQVMWRLYCLACFVPCWLDKEWASERSERRDQFLLVTNNFISLLSFNELKITPQKLGFMWFFKRENEGASKHRSQRPIERGMPISNVCISPILYKQCCHHPGCHCYPI